MSLYNDILSDVFGSGSIARKLGGFNSQVQAEFHYEISTALENDEIDRETFDKLWRKWKKTIRSKNRNLQAASLGLVPSTAMVGR